MLEKLPFMIIHTFHPPSMHLITGYINLRCTSPADGGAEDGDVFVECQQSEHLDDGYKTHDAHPDVVQPAPV